MCQWASFECWISPRLKVFNCRIGDHLKRYYSWDGSSWTLDKLSMFSTLTFYLYSKYNLTTVSWSRNLGDKSLYMRSNFSLNGYSKYNCFIHVFSKCLLSFCYVRNHIKYWASLSKCDTLSLTLWNLGSNE